MKKIDLKISKSYFSAKFNAEESKATTNDLNKAIFETLKRSSEDKMEEIRNKIVPIIKTCDVFISYSHDDAFIAKQVASFLINEGYKVFIDSLFWDSIDNALIEYNRKNCTINGKLDYSLIRKSNSTFNMILVDSIIDTIRSCKVFLFVNTGDYSTTPSPWLYLENKIANDFPNELGPLNEALTKDSKFTIQFPINTIDFFPTNSLNTLLFLLNH